MKNDEIINVISVGQGLILFKEHSNALQILNPLARWIWESSAAGMDKEELKKLLSEHGQNSKNVDELFLAWKSIGLRPAFLTKVAEKHLSFHVYWLGGGRIRVESNDQDILQKFHSCLAHVEDKHALGPFAGTITLLREENCCAIYKNQKKIHTVISVNELIVQALWEVIETGCRIPSRLMVIHGGAVVQDDICCVIAGAGGSGKTTLVAGLAASGCTLISDDVIPIDSRSGLLSSVPSCMCIKKGSWPVLHEFYPSAANLPTWCRFGKEVRFYPPPSSAVPDPTCLFRVNTILFPNYSPENGPQINPMQPHEVLAQLMQSNSIIDVWTSEKINCVADWISGINGYRIVYPDLTSGIELVKKILQQLSQR